MKAIIGFDTYLVLIEFEPFMGTNMKRYQREFDKWYYEMKTDIMEGKKVKYLAQRHDLPYKYFDVTPIFDWMKLKSPTSNPRILRTYTRDEEFDKTLPRISF